MKTSNRERTTGEAGSLIVEMIAVVPLYILLWLMGNWAYSLYVGVINNVATVKDCAWQMADSQCGSRGGGCSITGPIPEPPAEGAIGTRLQQVASGFTVLAPALRGPFGMGFTAEKRISLPGPPALNVPVVNTMSNYATLCDEKALPPPWTTETMFLAACPSLSRYCD